MLFPHIVSPEINEPTAMLRTSGFIYKSSDVENVAEASSNISLLPHASDGGGRQN
jgi:hypothetical protein